MKTWLQGMVIVAAAAHTAAATNGFYIVPGFDGQGTVGTSFVYLSSSGNQIVGRQGPDGPSDNTRTFIYQVGGSYTLLPRIINGIPFSGTGTNADASVLVGSAEAHISARYTRSTDEVTRLGSMPQYALGRPTAVSDDGRVTVGGYETTTNTYVGEAFMHTDATGLVGMGYARPFDFHSVARDVSSDGSVIVGQSYGGATDVAFRWTSSTGMQPLPYLDPVQGAVSNATVVSRNGEYIGGYSDIPGVLLNGTAVLWHENAVIALGSIPGMERDSGVYGVTDSGEAVGWGANNTTSTPFYWSASTGMIHLQALLQNNGVEIPAGITLLKAYDISADGRTVLGTARSSSLGTFVFVAVVPTPATGVVCGSALLLALRRNRSRVIVTRTRYERLPKDVRYSADGVLPPRRPIN